MIIIELVFQEHDSLSGGNPTDPPDPLNPNPDKRQLPAVRPQLVLMRMYYRYEY